MSMKEILFHTSMVARKINRFEDLGDKRKVFYEPTIMGKRLLEVLKEVAIPPNCRDKTAIPTDYR